MTSKNLRVILSPKPKKSVIKRLGFKWNQFKAKILEITMKTINNNKIHVINGAKVSIKHLECNTIKDVKILKSNEIKISYKLSNGSVKDFIIKENGACSLYDLEAFIAHFFRHYAVGVCSDDVLKAIAGSIYSLLIEHYNYKNINITEIVINNIRSFELPTHSHFNQDEDFQLPSASYHAFIASKLAEAAIHH